jgi:hypothetical protein
VRPGVAGLVSVRFASPAVGFGLTAGGQLVQTTDGGAFWQAAPLSVKGTALCVASATTAYVADEQGDVFRSTDAGASWSKDYQRTVPSAYGPLWSDLACDTDSAWQGMRVISPLLRQEAFLVVSRAASASSWSAIASSPASGPNLAPNSPGPDGLETFEGIASYQGAALVIGLPAHGFALGIAAGARPGAAPASPSYPTLRASQSLDALTTDPVHYIRVLGVSSLGSSAWVYVLDAAINGPAQRTTRWS